MDEGAPWDILGAPSCTGLKVAAHTANETGSGPYRGVVVDEGAGIAPEHLPYLIDRFYRVDAPRATPGSSLGLAIAKQIVEQHDGTISIASALCEGTTLMVGLPCA
jgi:two-component system sensor histidine kinase BaeS